MSNKPPIPEARIEAAFLAAIGAVSEGSDPQTPEQVPEAQRPRVQALFSPAISIAQPGDIKRLVESLKLEEGYAEALETQKVFQLLRTGEKAPDFDQVLKAFTPEMLAVAQTFQNPTMELISKDRSFEELITAMNDHKTMQDQRNVFLDDAFIHDQQKPEKWGACIIEGAPEMNVHGFDHIELTLRERLHIFSGHKKITGVGGTDRLRYAFLAMRWLMAGKAIDAEFWTLLDEDPALSQSHVPFALWHRGTPKFGFDRDPSSAVHGRARLRRSVCGYIPD